MAGEIPSRKMEALRNAAPVPRMATVAEVERWKKLAAMWCKRALKAETELAIMVEGVVR